MRNRLCSAGLLAGSLTCLILAVVANRVHAQTVINPWPLPPGAQCGLTAPAPYSPGWSPIPGMSIPECKGSCPVPEQCDTIVAPPNQPAGLSCSCVRHPVVKDEPVDPEIPTEP